jgi:hypothetical protein
VEPILIKGWSSALLYPGLELRPSCDVDLCIPAAQADAATSALSARPLPCAVDLHLDVPDLPDRTWPELLARSRLAAIGEVAVRVLGPEDQLRLVCLHQARHGLARPLWLCDVGACLESLPEDFDWGLWGFGDRTLSGWAGCVLGLACRLLDAKRAPWQADVPGWVERAVLRSWGAAPGRGSAPIRAAFQLGLGPGTLLPGPLVRIAAFARRKAPRVLRLLRPRRRVVRGFCVHHHRGAGS